MYILQRFEITRKLDHGIRSIKTSVHCARQQNNLYSSTKHMFACQSEWEKFPFTFLIRREDLVEEK